MIGDLPEWVLPAAFVSAVFSVFVGFAWRNYRRQIARTHARRTNPSRDEFVSIMGSDVSAEATDFLWDTALFYLKPRLTPHPDDDLARDLPIDDGDWSMDWPRDFADLHGFDQSAYPDWPQDTPVTLRNFGIWLDAGRGKRSAIDFSPVPHSNHQYHQSIVFDQGDHAVVTETIAPVASVVADHRFAALTGAVEGGHVP